MGQTQVIDTKLDDEIDQLRNTIADNLRDQFRSFPPHQALQAAQITLDSLQQALGGVRLYIPAGKQPDYTSARKDYLAGMPADQVRRKYGISQRSFYRHVRSAEQQPQKAAPKRRRARQCAVETAPTQK